MPYACAFRKLDHTQQRKLNINCIIHMRMKKSSRAFRRIYFSGLHSSYKHEPNCHSVENAGRGRGAGG